LKNSKSLADCAVFEYFLRSARALLMSFQIFENLAARKVRQGSVVGNPVRGSIFWLGCEFAQFTRSLPERRTRTPRWIRPLASP